MVGVVKPVAHWSVRRIGRGVRCRRASRQQHTDRTKRQVSSYHGKPPKRKTLPSCPFGRIGVEMSNFLAFRQPPYDIFAPLCKVIATPRIMPSLGVGERVPVVNKRVPPCDKEIVSRRHDLARDA